MTDQPQTTDIPVESEEMRRQYDEALEQVHQLKLMMYVLGGIMIVLALAGFALSGFVLTPNETRWSWAICGVSAIIGVTVIIAALRG